MRADERLAENKRMRGIEHQKKCLEFGDMIYNVLLIETPEKSDIIMEMLEKLLFGDEKDGLWKV